MARPLPYLVCGAALLLFVAPFFILGEDVHVLVRDNLDSSVVRYKIIAESGMLTAGSGEIVPNLLGGTPRATLPSEFRLITWMYFLLPAFPAYVLNQLVMRLVAFVGMLLLARRLGPRLAGRDQELLPLGIALAFSLLPFWPFGGIGVAGQPLLLHAFLHLREPSGRPAAARSYAVIAFFAVYSSLVFTGVFVLAALACILAFDLARGRRPLLFLGGIALLATCYAVIEHRMLANLLLQIDSTFVSHRTEFQLEGWSASEGVALARLMFRNTHYEANAIPFPVIHLAWLAGLACGAVRALRGREAPPWPLVAALGCIALIAAFYGLHGSEWYVRNVKTTLPLLAKFQLSRFYTLLPLLFFTTFTWALLLLARSGWVTRFAAYVLVAAQVVVAVQAADEFRYRDGPTYREFYAEALFDDIRAEIGEPAGSYRVGSVALHPAVAQYNGFHTVGGYVASYPLSYKHRFREVIARELENNQMLREYYDNWGSRAYLFSSALGHQTDFPKGGEQRLVNLELDIERLHALGGRYIVSSLQILGSKGLRFRGRFDAPDSRLEIFLYDVISTPGISRSNR